MNEVTYLGICCSLVAYLESAVARRRPDDGILHSQIIFNLAVLVSALVLLTGRS
jgi:hypothetical protein